MKSYIKILSEYKEVLTVYKKVNDVWEIISDLSSALDNDAIYIYDSNRIDITLGLSIIGENSYTCKNFILSAKYNNRIVNPSWSILSGNAHATINSNGKVTIAEGTINEILVVQASYKESTITKQITISYDNELTIEGADTITGTSGNVIARYNSTIVTPSWGITQGNGLASIDNDGIITITASGTIIIEADYNGYSASKEIELIYDAGSSTETTIDENGTITTETTTTIVDDETGSTTTTTTTTVTNEDGSSSSTETEVTENSDGSSTTTTTTTNSDGSTTESTVNTSAPDSETGAVTTQETTTTTNGDGTSSETTSTIVENQDGSSTSSSSTTNYDENGDATGSTTNETTNNADGSSTSTTTNYNEDGNPTDTTNQNNDADGNTSTQTIEYNDNGDPVVTGYDIDTSGSDDGTKPLNGEDHINTEYYAFDMTHGFEIEFNFTINFTQQPANQNENHHNILTMKRASPEPWYGFQLRQSSTNKYIQLGTQFSTGGNTNTQISPISTVNNISEYNLKIIYDPTLANNSFKCINLNDDSIIYQSNGKFPDLEELKYLKVTLGCALDPNGDPYRYSNIDILKFTLKKLHNIENPEISCDGRIITITCATQGATIYYKLNNTGDYLEYTAPISINSDTTVQAYSKLVDETSDIITRTYIYDNGIEEPIISCDGRIVTITDTNQGTRTIMYRLGQSGSYSEYTTPISIIEDTIVQAYVQIGNEISDIITENCLYDNGIESPTISFDGELITISTEEPSADIYYRLDNGEFTLYEGAIEIFADTVIKAYVSVNNTNSHIVSRTCVYDPILLENPVIICNGTEITISCSTSNAIIYYKLNQNGNFIQYTAPIAILTDTYVEAYSTVRGKQSTVVNQNCIYQEIHDYSKDYLTFRILSNGTVWWQNNGSGYARTIEYSLNNGTWTSIAATTAGVSINVSVNDVIRFRGTNVTYAKDKSNYSGFGYGEQGTSGQSNYHNGAAEFNIEGNIMSLIYGDNFINQTTFNGGTYTFCSMFKKAKCVSAENLVLLPITLVTGCYRAMFSWCTYLIIPPTLPATTLAQYCYWYMFEECGITTAPELPAQNLVANCYGSMFTNCRSLNYIKCMAIAGFNTSNCKQTWVNGVASSGVFVKDSGISVSTWTRGTSGIPTNWLVYDDVPVSTPVITYDGFSTITLTCETQGANIYYKLNNTGNYIEYSNPIIINGDTIVQTYSSLNGADSRVITQTCIYVSDIPLEASNRDLKKWNYNNQEITTPYSVNGIDGHSANYSKGTFNFETSFALRSAQPAYLWFQHADQSASIYIDNILVEKHWGGYTAFTVDISNYVHSGSNNVKVALKNNEGNYLAPAAGDFNFNATLGNVKLFTSPVLPDMKYGYDGFHVTSTVTTSSATIYVKTLIPSGASVICTITDGTFNYTDTKPSTGEEMTFSTNIINPHLWNGIIDPHLYTITLEIYYNNELYHRFIRPYGLRFYEYVINDSNYIINGNPYTGFLLNGAPYQLNGVCMHDDIAGKANALNDADYNQTFSIISELNCNFIRLAHYPHPKEVYDRCDALGIIVQTEGPCVNKLHSTMPEDYYTHLTTQYTDMVNQHYNHPCILFWGLSNETTTDDKDFGKTKIEYYTSLIKTLDTERLVGYVMSHSTEDPSGYYNHPINIDWFGCNIYTGWYIDQNTNNPSNRINKRITNVITNRLKALAYSEYGCGGTQTCHSDNFMDTTTRGNNARHDIEYMMWLHEGQIAAIKNYPQLLFTAEWQLFDIAVSNRNEGYTECIDGETTSINDDLRRLNNKGLVERDHITKKDPFYLYKAWWNETDKFVHICGKDYTKKTDRVIKCYTNDGNSLSLYVNNTFVETVTVTDNIATFTSATYSSGDIIRVESTNESDTLTF